MKYVSEMLAKPILSLYECKIVGLIKNFAFDKNFKKLKYLIIFDDVEQDEKTIDTKDIYSIGDDAVTIKNLSICSLLISQLSEEDILYPANANVFTYGGKNCGNLKDIEIDKNFNVLNIKLNDDSLHSSKDLLNWSSQTIILQENKKIKLCNCKNKTMPKNLTVTQEQVVNILEQNENISPEELENKQISVKATYKFDEEKVKYERMTTNYSFLLGRKLKSHLYSQNREILAKKDTKITQKTITDANKNLKLRELILLSK